MADGASTWVICKDLLVVPVPSGLLMLTNRTTASPDPVLMARALHQSPLPGTVALYLDAGAEMSAPVQRYVSALTGPERARLVIVPSPSAGPAGDTKALEGIADFYGVRVHAGPGLAPSPRTVSVDGDEQETAAADATATRVLPRLQSAMRGAVHTAVDLATGGPAPSWQRLEQYLDQVPEIRPEAPQPWRVFGGESPSPAPYALGVYLARYGAPAGVVEVLRRSVAPVTSAQLYELLGGTPARVDPDALIVGLLDAPGSAALVRSAPRGSGPERLMWLMSDDGPEPKLWWVEPPDGRGSRTDGPTMSVALADPASHDRRMAVLLDPGTRVVRVDPAGRAIVASTSRSGPPAARPGAPDVPEEPLPAPGQPAAPVEPIPAPVGTRYVGPVLVVDTGDSWRQRADTLTRIVHAARDAQRPVVAINVLHGLAQDGPELTALRTVLVRYQRLGARPVVVATSGSDAYAAVRAQFRPVTVEARTDGLEQRWQVTDPAGVVHTTAAGLTPALFAAADTVPVAPDDRGLPPVLARWLAQNTWTDAERYLRDNITDLLRPDVGEALHNLRRQEPGDREVGAYDVILGLVRAAGGVADPSAQRFAPTGPVDLTAIEPGPVLSEPLRETFAFDYLQPHAAVGLDDDAGEKRKLRKPWDDELLWLTYTGGRARGPQEGRAWMADMAALAGALDEAGERRVVAKDGAGTVRRFSHGQANATVFTAVSTVLGIDAETTRHLAAQPDPVGANPVLRGAVTQIQACQLSPIDRVAWVVRMSALEQRITADGRPELAGLLRILTETLASCP
ncbi:hypothetical protein [Dactylosporangium sp. CA-139066]|uniref:hypothetical protein n=1 Tax=Dactylosporangium sp. CA-139066 TaxID=3239930 RepID=UPI003D9111EA